MSRLLDRMLRAGIPGVGLWWPSHGNWPAQKRRTVCGSALGGDAGPLTMRRVLALVFILTTQLFPVRAEEPARAFLDGLRSRGYHDTALGYLQSLEVSRIAPSGILDVLDYERALTLVEASRVAGDLTERFKMLDEAQALLRNFIQIQASHPTVNAARSQLGNLIVERARIKVEQAKSGNSDALKAEARKLYDQAFKEFALLEEAVAGELDQIPKVLNTRDREEAKLAERRKQLRADNLQTELLAAAIREEAADTVPSGSKERTDYLIESAGLYDAIYKKYRSRLAGLYARMYQGRCNHRLGRTKDALGYYGELLDQPSTPEAFWNLKTKTLRLAMESWLHPQERKYVEAIKQASEWVDFSPRSSERNPDMLAIRLSLARALQMQAEAYEKRQSRDVATIRNSYEYALKHATFVAAEEGDLQAEARDLVVALGGRANVDPDAVPDTFAAAQKKGKESLDEIGPASEEVARLAALLRRAASSDRDKLQQELSQSQTQLEEVQASALAFYRLAIRLADRDTPPTELNLVRYFVCYLHYLKQQYHDAAVVGDFVSRRFPQSAGAKQCAKISLACYLKLLELSGDDSSAFEIERIAETTRWIADQWAETPEAVESLATAVSVMVNSSSLQNAREFTLRLPESSPERSRAQLVTGQAMWGAFLSRQHAAAVSDDKQGSAPFTGLTQKQLQTASLELLLAGYQQLPEDVIPDSSNATAMLSLAQALLANSSAKPNAEGTIDLDAGKPVEGLEQDVTGPSTLVPEDNEVASDPVLVQETLPATLQAYLGAGKAVEVLEHDVVGPLTLVQEVHEVASNPVFVQETLRTALQAYVGAMDENPVEMMSKAQATMALLRQAVGLDATGKKRMLAIYISLAQTIEAKMKTAPPESRKQMSSVFESFLQALSADASDPGTLNWVAETFASLGAGFDSDEAVLSEDARLYYDRSIAAFQNLLGRLDLPQALQTQLRARMAAVKARKRDYQGALTDLEQLLALTPSAVNLQVEAARLLQRWGKADSAKYVEAIRGIRSGEKGGVWGWGKIATATMPHLQFRDMFYEARYEMAACQFGIAMSKSGADRAKQLATAERSLATTQTLYPTLGGEQWKTKYKQLLTDIQTAGGAKR